MNLSWLNPVNWLKPVVELVAKPLADISGGFRERQKIAAQSVAVIAQAKVDYKLAKLKAKTDRLTRTNQGDVDYDMAVINQRNDTIMDNVVIFVFLGIFIFHFIPGTQDHMLSGWKSMGYKGAPWWFEFAIVGVLVSTLGLMRLFRIFWRVKPAAKVTNVYHGDLPEVNSNAPMSSSSGYQPRPPKEPTAPKARDLSKFPEEQE